MLRVTARAKINWTLDILGQRADGYHLMDMLLGSVELCDTLWLQRAKDLSLGVESEGYGGPEGAAAPPAVAADRRNLVMKAALALQEATGCRLGAEMRLVKRIPVGAGMGGGSADAAAALLGLCALWNLKVPGDRLEAIALALGADVPFLLRGGLARVQGIGEAIRPLPPPAPIWLVAVQPCRGLSTQEIFRAFDEAPGEALLRPDTQGAEKALLRRDLPSLAKAMGNSLEPVSAARRPEIPQAIEALEEQGALRAMMTGSGSAVYGLFEDEKTARAAFSALRDRWAKTYLTRTAGESVTVEKA
ncbi:MAG: 4-(cytidine 5'-diphospho)-2-C-methyl-D-erythritol kinase [Candidatus Limiplasma sp.]|nr:4-(cytidine 5'-diphospho)-2-C-methyl-D-erythritol kinase [Candidatus Limiplasma sp.]